MIYWLEYMHNINVQGNVKSLLINYGFPIDIEMVSNEHQCISSHRFVQQLAAAKRKKDQWCTLLSFLWRESTADHTKGH